MNDVVGLRAAVDGSVDGSRAAAVSRDVPEIVDPGNGTVF